MPRHVLITTSIIVHVPDADDEGFTFVEPYSHRLREAIGETFRGSSVVEYPAAETIEWIDLDDMNIGKCVDCDTWASDYTKPGALKGLVAGRVVDGRLICDECEVFGEGSSTPKS